MLLLNLLLLFSSLALARSSYLSQDAVASFNSLHSLLHYSLTAENVDQNMFFGLIIIKGQLTALRARYSGFPPVQRKLENLLVLCEALLDKYPTPMFNSRTVNQLVAAVGGLDGKLRTLKGSRPMIKGNGSLLKSQLPNRNQSDTCVMMLIEDCRVSTECLLLETNPYSVGYSLSHQALYFILSNFLGCEDTQLGSGSDKDLYIKNLCSRILIENDEIRKLGVSSKYLDLFVEQVAVCGMYGYAEFLDPQDQTFLRSLQSQKGCFSRNFLQEGHAKDCDIHLSAVCSVAISSFLYYATK